MSNNLFTDHQVMAQSYFDIFAQETGFNRHNLNWQNLSLLMDQTFWRAFG